VSVVGVLIAAGIFAGLMLVPLNAALQAESDHSHLGKTIAIQNFVDYLAMLLGAGFLGLLTGFGLGPKTVFVALAAALAALALALRFAKNVPSAAARPPAEP
jgi:LPLT family lysophospholipid transporter-like MFS transporter